jgi:cytochrome P450
MSVCLLAFETCGHQMLTEIALRLRPVVPANTREAIRDTILPLGGGEDGQSPMFVKKGTHVYYSVYSMHRREEFFGEMTEEYKPERWEGLKLGWVCMQGYPELPS